MFSLRLTKDPEIRYSQSDNSMAIARVNGAVDRRIKRQGEPDADFITLIAFGKTAEFLEKYCHKGIKLIVETHVQCGSYTNKEGQKVYTTEFVIDNVEFAESKKDPNATTQPANDEGFMSIEGDLEELPFQ